MVIAHKHSISVGLSNLYKNGSYGVRIRVCYNGERTDLHTRLSATRQQWDSSKQRYKHGCTVDGIQYNILNSNIDGYIDYINDYFNKASLREIMPSLSELKNNSTIHLSKVQKNKLKSFSLFLRCLYNRILQGIGLTNMLQCLIG